MTKELWLNLPVQDVRKSKEFFTRLGFTFNTQHSDTDDAACLLVGNSNVVVMLFAEPTFKNFSKQEIAPTQEVTEILLSLGAATRNEVDDMAQKVLEAGGTIFSEPAEIQGWMYGCGFADLDGHRWNVLYMDASKLNAEETNKCQ